MTTRNGKIAHLPRPLRDELNQRLDNGVPGHELLAWLNIHPDVQPVLAKYYPGRRITQQNLSEWRQGGYQEWFKLQETHKLTLQLAKEPETAETKISPQKVMAALAQVTTLEFMHASNIRMRECTSTQERWEHACQMTTHFSRLRAAEHRAATYALNQKRHDYQLATEQRTIQKTAQAEARRELLAHLEQLSEGRFLKPITGRVPNIPASAPDPSNASDQSNSTRQQTKNQVENAHFPSGTDSHQVKIISTNQPASIAPDARKSNIVNRKLEAINPTAQRSDFTLIHQGTTPTHQTGIKAKSAHFPSGTGRHQAHFFSLDDAYAPMKPTPKFLCHLSSPAASSPAGPK